MSDFDPYYIWLGIPPKHQPPNHYVLLGVEPLEENVDVIANAADQRMAYLRTFQTGKHSKLSQKLLNEVAAAKVCLLNPEKKAAYDRRQGRRPDGVSAPRQETAPDGRWYSPEKEKDSENVPEVPAGVPVIRAAPQRVSVVPLGQTAATAAPSSLTVCGALPRHFALWVTAGAASGIIVLVLLFALSGQPGQDLAADSDTPVPPAGAVRAADSHGTAHRDESVTKAPRVVPESTGTDQASSRRVQPPETSPTPFEDEPALSQWDLQRPVFEVPDSKNGLQAQVSDPAIPPPKDFAASFEAVSQATSSSMTIAEERLDAERPFFVPPSEQSLKRPVEQAPVVATVKPPSENAPRKDDPSTPSEKGPARLPVPSAAEQQAVVQRLAQILSRDGIDTPEASRKLAGKYLAAARGTQGDANERYVLLLGAMEAAREGGDAVVMLAAAERLGEVYQVDALQVQCESLKLFAKQANDAERLKSLLRSSRRVIDEAVARQRYEVAADLARAIHATCQGREGRGFRKTAASQRAALETLAREHQRAERAAALLESTPNDSAAHLTLGRWCCFMRGDWQQGLPHLLDGSDAELKQLAERELNQPPGTAADRLKLADAWWTLAERRDGEEQAALRLRAGHWYDLARNGLTSGLDRLKAEKRFETVQTLRAELARDGSYLAWQPNADGSTPAWSGTLP